MTTWFQVGTVLWYKKQNCCDQLGSTDSLNVTRYASQATKIHGSTNLSTENSGAISGRGQAESLSCQSPSRAARPTPSHHHHARVWPNFTASRPIFVDNKPTKSPGTPVWGLKNPGFSGRRDGQSPLASHMSTNYSNSHTHISQPCQFIEPISIDPVVSGTHSLKLDGIPQYEQLSKGTPNWMAK